MDHHVIISNDGLLMMMGVASTNEPRSLVIPAAAENQKEKEQRELDDAERDGDVHYSRVCHGVSQVRMQFPPAVFYGESQALMQLSQKENCDLPADTLE